MKLALIPPLSLLDTTMQTNYQLMLPQLTDSARYSAKYRTHCKSDSTYVILDNGAAEGVDTPFVALLDLATRYGVNELVIPDVMTDAQATIERAIAFYDEAVPPMSMPRLKFNLMFVVQGTTMAEVLETSRWALGQWWIDTIGIPRHLLDTLGSLTARSDIANILSSYASCKPIHFLGANSNHPMEIGLLASEWSTNQKFVRGMDTSIPFSYAYAGRKLDSQKLTEKGLARPDDYFNLPSASFDNDVMQYNIDLLRKHTEVL